MLTEGMAGRAAFPEKMARYLEEFNRDKYVIIGVESVAAIERLDELIAVPGVDGVFLGPHDITTSMGIPTEYTNPRFIDTVESIVRRCRSRSIGVGLHTQLLKLPEGVLERFLEAGMNWLLNSADVIIMREALNDQFSKLRKFADRRSSATLLAEATRATVQSCLTGGNGSA